MTAAEPTTGDPVRDALAAAAIALRSADHQTGQPTTPAELMDRASALADVCSRLAAAASDLAIDVGVLHGQALLTNDELIATAHIGTAMAELDAARARAMDAHGNADRAHERLARLIEADSERG